MSGTYDKSCNLRRAVDAKGTSPLEAVISSSSLQFLCHRSHKAILQPRPKLLLVPTPSTWEDRHGGPALKGRRPTERERETEKPPKSVPPRERLLRKGATGPGAILTF